MSTAPRAIKPKRTVPLNYAYLRPEPTCIQIALLLALLTLAGLIPVCGLAVVLMILFNGL
jgi:hypothetical protein